MKKMQLRTIFNAIFAGAIVVTTMTLQNTCSATGSAYQHSPLALWYLQPADNAMQEALPIGNGRMGGLIMGGIEHERLVVNEDSLWNGDKNTSGDYGTMGTYEELGELHVDIPTISIPSGYGRDLDIANATSHVSYKLDGITYSREFFASYPAQVIVARFTADHPNAYTGTIEFNGSRKETTTVAGNRLTFSGTLSNGTQYEAQAQVIATGGTLSANGSTLAFDKCSSIEIVIGAGTSYVMDYAKNYRGDNPHARVAQQVDRASEAKYADLLHDHIADYKSLFDRVRIDLGRTSPDRLLLPTDARKILAIQGDDPQFEALLYQYGRYLMISCSRPGGLPANLQGLWCDSNNPPWDSDYHTDLNIEMNYWPVETANLPECAVPIFDLVDSQVSSWRILTQAAPEYKLASGQQPTSGWDMRASFNINGGMGWLWIKTSNAWLLQTYWEHYAFTGDKAFLRDRAYPLMKEVSEFWDQQLKALPDGELVVPQGWSPEHGNFEDGTSFNQELVWDLFTNTIAASKALGVDQDFRAHLESVRSKLYEPKIGSWGQLQEWMADKDDPTDHHRHTSHLIGVYPGHQFSVEDTPALMAAAKVSLLHRGNIGDVAEWSFAWRTALFARMRDGENAHNQLMHFCSARDSCVNLFARLADVDPQIMQIDGNFGISAAVAEMLLQSQNDQIVLLPALPAAWQTGSVNGLCARGGFVIDESWTGGKLSSVTVHSKTGTERKLVYGAHSTVLHLTPGQSITLNGMLAR
jgi:alpha-L-fucosidase 2